MRYIIILSLMCNSLLAQAQTKTIIGLGLGYSSFQVACFTPEYGLVLKSNNFVFLSSQVHLTQRSDVPDLIILHFGHSIKKWNLMPAIGIGLRTEYMRALYPEKDLIDASEVVSIPTRLYPTYTITKYFHNKPWYIRTSNTSNILTVTVGMYTIMNN